MPSPYDAVVQGQYYTLRDVYEAGFEDLRKGGGAGAGVPPFDSVFPAAGARSSKIQYDGRKRRSCSPSLTYVISCRDFGPWRSAYAAESGADHRTLADLSEELSAVRTATLLLLRSLPEDAWNRRGVASGNEFTVRSLAWIIAGHSRHHRKVLMERYLA